MAIIIMVGDEKDLRSGLGERALLTTEAQAVLKLGSQAFRALVQKGDLTPYDEQIGNYVLWLAKDVEELRQKRLKRY